jgi:hypothetical protein
MATVSDPDGDPPDGVEFVHEDDGESIDDPEAYLAEQGDRRRDTAGYALRGLERRSPKPSINYTAWDK